MVDYSKYSTDDLLDDQKNIDPESHSKSKELMSESSIDDSDDDKSLGIYHVKFIFHSMYIRGCLKDACREFTFSFESSGHVDKCCSSLVNKKL